MKIIGGLVLLLGLLITLVGVGGAAANLLFPPEQVNCKIAEERFQTAKAAVEKYEQAKGTPGESAAKAAADSSLESSKLYSESCGRTKDSMRNYGFIFLGVAVVGFVISLIGIGAIALGFHKKKA